MVTTTANAADLYQYPPSEFRWRLWLLIERIDEVFVAAQKAGMCQPSLRDPRGDWARDHIDRDPFAGAVWNCGSGSAARASASWTTTPSTR